MFVPINNAVIRVMFVIVAILIVVPVTFFTIVGSVIGVGLLAVYFLLGKKKISAKLTT